MIGPAEETPASTAPLRLPEEYDDACLGHSLDPRGARYSRYIYSMTRMVEVHRKKFFLVDAKDAAETVWKLIEEIARDHGDRMPVFVEDSKVENGPKLWVPPGH